MGIWNEGILICGTRVELSLDVLENIKKYDSTFNYFTTDDSDTNPEFRVCLKDKDIKYNDINGLVCNWLHNLFPKLTLLSSSPYYDCPGNRRRYFLSFNLKLSEIEANVPIKDVIDELRNITPSDMDTFKEVFDILFPNQEYNEPMIQAHAYIF